jgi:hypothetical protein
MKKSENKAAASAAGKALSKLAVEAKKKKFTKRERSEQSRTAVAMRRDRQKGPWHGLVLYPKNLVWKGAQHAAQVLDEMHANPEVVFWSRSRSEVLAKQREYSDNGQMSEVIEQNWNPASFTIQRTYDSDTGAQAEALRRLAEGQRGANE